MSHPHPDPLGHPAGTSPGDEPPELQLAERSAPRRARQWTVAALLTVVLVVAAVWVTASALAGRHQARSSKAAAGKLCDQVQGLGQPCVVDPTTGEQAAAAQAQVPAPPTVSAAPLPGAPAATRTTPSVADESAAQAGQPDGPYTNPDPAIVGLAVVDGRLRITYDDGTVVDAGRLDGPPPAIVVPVPDRAPAPSPSAAAPDSSAPAAETSAAATDTPTPEATP